jgi:hypothetical protein
MRCASGSGTYRGLGNYRTGRVPACRRWSCGFENNPRRTHEFQFVRHTTWFGGSGTGRHDVHYPCHCDYARERMPVLCSESHLDGIRAPCAIIRASSSKDDARFWLPTGTTVIAVPSSGRRDGDIRVGSVAGAF